MKRSILAAILGVSGAVSAFGQGHVLLSNYLASPYAQVYWSGGANDNHALTAADGLTFQMYYGAGVVGSFAGLTAGGTFTIANDPSSTVYDPGAGHGPGGYWNIDQAFPWTSGPETFAYTVITPGYTGTSALWQENSAITSTANPANGGLGSIGLAVTPTAVPEPTTMALAGLGAAAMLIFRKRQ